MAGISQRGKCYGEKKRLQGKMECLKAIVSEMEDVIRNTLLRARGKDPGCSGADSDMGKLRGFGELYNSEGDLSELQNDKENLGNLKNLSDFEGERDSSTFEGKGQEMKNSQGKIRTMQKEIVKRSSND